MGKPEAVFCEPVTSPPPVTTGWKAQLNLTFAHRDSGSFLAQRSQFGPLGLQKTLYPEGPNTAHGIILHPPGGIAGGDQLAINIAVGAGAAALLTTPGATKWYRSAGAQARQNVELNVADHACLEWLPQENIVFDQALAASHTHVKLGAQARFIGWEITAFGRPAANLAFEQGCFSQRWKIEQAGRLLWLEQGELHGNDPRFKARAGLQGYSVMGTLVAVGTTIDAALLEELRNLNAEGLTGITQTPRGVLLVRCLSPNTESARCYLNQVWAMLRPTVIGATAHHPRIWNT